MRLLALLLALTVTVPLTAQDSIAQERAIPLLKTIHDTIRYYHPFGQTEEGRQLMSAALEQGVNELQQAVDLPGDSIGQQPFVLAAGHLQSAVQCGHLQLNPNRPPAWIAAREHRLRFGLIRTSDDKYVLSDTLTKDTTVLPRGTVITKIDQSPVADLISRLAVFQGMNDQGHIRSSEIRIARNPIGLYESRYGLRDSIQITYVDLNDGQEQILDLGMELDHEPDTLEIKKLTRKEKKARRKLKHTSVFDLYKSKDSTAWVLQVRSFNSSYYNGINFNKLLKRTFDTINESNLDKLILDLQSNGGGNIAKAREFTRYLAKAPFRMTDKISSTSPKANGTNLWHKWGLFVVAKVRKIDGEYRMLASEKELKPARKVFKGELVVVIDELSFSATTLVANALKESNSATVIGQVTGGGRTQLYGGNIRDIIIGEKDELQFKVVVPNWRFQPWNAGPGTVSPDVVVPITQEDVISGKHPNVQAALDILHGN